MERLPQHLQKYIVDQNAKKYTAIDHSVWRYILRQLKNFLSQNAHSAYLSGLEKTGVSINEIPDIQAISQKLEKFGWQALPVSGFIPPAAFMELQSLSVLPIASDMRSIDHLEYTPAPDIVHEAAGHAPLLADPEYAAYLKRYATVAKKAIISKEDLDLYTAIRLLSDLKENPTSTSEQIRAAEEKLNQVASSMSHISEATLLGRMNWWTAEYGLIGDLKHPKIFGAGLLSSVGESKWCLSEKVKKIPLSIDCVKYSYDITEPQPQLFVTPDFKTLVQVLEELADTMAFRKGGAESLNKVVQAASINTIQLNTGLQISGLVETHISTDQNQTHFVRLKGPVQLAYQDQEISGHGSHYHASGFSTPLGDLKKFPGQCPSTLSDEQWQSLGLALGQKLKLEFNSGFVVEGIYIGRLVRDHKTLLLTLKESTALWNDKVYFKPSWGNFDIALASKIPSVFGGPADRASYGEVVDFSVQRVPEPQWTESQLQLQKQYEKVRFLRENNPTSLALAQGLSEVLDFLEMKAPKDWLLLLEVYELTHESPLEQKAAHELAERVLEQLNVILKNHPHLQSKISDGLDLAKQAL